MVPDVQGGRGARMPRSHRSFGKGDSLTLSLDHVSVNRDPLAGRAVIQHRSPDGLPPPGSRVILLLQREHQRSRVRPLLGGAINRQSAGGGIGHGGVASGRGGWFGHDHGGPERTGSGAARLPGRDRAGPHRRSGKLQSPQTAGSVLVGRPISRFASGMGHNLSPARDRPQPAPAGLLPRDVPGPPRRQHRADRRPRRRARNANHGSARGRLSCGDGEVALHHL